MTMELYCFNLDINPYNSGLYLTTENKWADEMMIIIIILKLNKMILVSMLVLLPHYECCLTVGHSLFGVMY